MTRDELMQYLQDLTKNYVHKRNAIWWNGELIPISEAMTRANELDDADTVQLVRGEILINAKS